jgi:hypothetical protein
MSYRRTGVTVPNTVKKDSEGFDDIDDFFAKASFPKADPERVIVRNIQVQETTDIEEEQTTPISLSSFVTSEHRESIRSPSISEDVSMSAVFERK